MPLNLKKRAICSSDSKLHISHDKHSCVADDKRHNAQTCSHRHNWLLHRDSNSKVMRHIIKP